MGLIMKCLVQSPIKYNGSFYPIGSFIDFKSEEDIPANLVPFVESVSSSTKETAKPVTNEKPAAKKKAAPKTEKKIVSKTKSKGK